MKKQQLICLFAILIMAAPAESAQKHWYRDWKTWAGVGIIGFSTGLDAHSTCQAFAHGAVETSLALNGNRSCATAAETMAGAFAFYTTLHALESHFGHKDESRFVRDVTPWAIPAVVAGIHLSAAIHNYEITK